MLGEVHYGNLGAGKAPAINYINNRSDPEYEALVEAIRELLHGERALGERIDSFLTVPAPGVKEAAATQLLSIWNISKCCRSTTSAARAARARKG